MEKLNLHSPDFTQANIEKLAELFPNCVTETRAADGTLKKVIDFDLLKQELSTSIVEGPQERYQLNWPGKREALLTANAPIAKTLRPCREESVDFDTTQNLYIEGDNLDALKLLQETYLGKVKMIYIDPPYNTGNDFIYEDDFAENTEAYFERSNQKDEVGNRLVANNESNGRFHSDWLSMMYSRLKLARNLLKDDGVIFISIDDNEQANLKRLCDEVFGEDNFVATICVKMSHLSGVKMSHADKKPPKIKEYVLIYVRSKENFTLKPIYEKSDWNEALDRYSQFITNKNERFENWVVIPVRQAAIKNSIDTADKKKYEDFLIDNAERIFRTARNKSLESTGIRNKFTKIISKTGLTKFVYNDEEVLFASEKMTEIDGKLLPVNILGDIWLDIGINNLHNEGEIDFKNGKKPLKLLKRCISLVSQSNDIILDFFSGSATTAHAVMQINAEDGGNRKFIMVQLSEPCDEKSEAYKAGFATIAEIGKKRIRRAGQKIKTEETPDLDIGFRVLKVDSSNMKDVYYTPDKLIQGDLEQFTDNIRDDSTPEDLLFQVLLDWGVDLTLPITQETIAGFTVLFVDDNALAACFDADITEAFVKELAARQPMRVVFRDAGFASDSVKINIEQIFKLISPATEIKVI